MPNSDAESGETLLTALDKVGVDFSVQRSEIVGWLANPDFTPYPAVAGALLQLLEPKPLRRPVFMDVVVANYEERSGGSPRRVEEVDQPMLEAAVLEAWNVRYGVDETDFKTLLK
jgi:hypothetical protein